MARYVLDLMFYLVSVLMFGLDVCFCLLVDRSNGTMPTM